MPKSHVSNNLELMAPVGSYESLMSAINAGCDSIFFGISQLNMRARASKSMNIDDLHKVATICHKHNIKAYLTLNTLLYDHDISLTKNIIDEVKKSGIDSIIAVDMAAIAYAKKIGVPVHISTQLSVSNVETVQFYSQFADVVVLARELTLPLIKNLCNEVIKRDIRGPSGELVKIEVFGHGAMCIAVSGRCSMSTITENSSANRGACRQNCRRKYKVIDEETGTAMRLENDYVLSPSDLCTIGMLDELAETGLSVLKIEGRGRSADYVDQVISCYREALDSLNEGTYTQEKIDAWNKRLGTVYNRDHSHGFYLGEPWVKWSGAYGNKATKTRVQVGVVENYYVKIGIVQVDMNAGEITSSDEYQIVGPTTGILRGEKPDLWLDKKQVSLAEKGTNITFKVSKRVREGDIVYKVVDTEKKHD